MRYSAMEILTSKTNPGRPQKFHDEGPQRPPEAQLKQRRNSLYNFKLRNSRIFINKLYKKGKKLICTPNMMDIQLQHRVIGCPLALLLRYVWTSLYSHVSRGPRWDRLPLAVLWPSQTWYSCNRHQGWKSGEAMTWFSRQIQRTESFTRIVFLPFPESFP